MSSRGAWPHYYQLGLDYTSDPQGREAYGIYAFKNELVFNGFGVGHVNLTLAKWGNSAVKATKAAQTHFGIGADGVLGPHTARCLFRKRTVASESAYSIPNDLLQKIKTLESDNDPVAQGWADLEDEGLYQENGPSNPTLTQQQRWTPGFITGVAAKQLHDRINQCGSVKAGVAGWNVGNFYATKWREAGYPNSGGPVVDGQDMFSRASQYWNLVSGQPL